MGVLEEKAFEIAAKAKYPAEEAPNKAEEMISLWVKYIEDPDWHPFKTIHECGTDKVLMCSTTVVISINQATLYCHLKAEKFEYEQTSYVGIGTWSI